VLQRNRGRRALASSASRGRSLSRLRLPAPLATAARGPRSGLAASSLRADRHFCPSRKALAAPPTMTRRAAASAHEDLSATRARCGSPTRFRGNVLSCPDGARSRDLRSRRDRRGRADERELGARTPIRRPSTSCRAAAGTPNNITGSGSANLSGVARGACVWRVHDVVCLSEPIASVAPKRPRQRGWRYIHDRCLPCR